MKKNQLAKIILMIASSAIIPATALAVQLQPGGGLTQQQGTLQGGSTTGSEAPDQQQAPQARQSYQQVPEKLDFVFQGHQYMTSIGNHFVSDYQTLLRDIESVNQGAWGDLYNRSQEEFLTYSSRNTPTALASAPAGALAIVALDNAGAVGRQNVQYGVPFLFEGLGEQQGSDCEGTVRGMLSGKCQWGTPPVIESAVFANIIGDDVNLNQLGGAYEVWGVAPARATLINLIFNQGLFQ